MKSDLICLECGNIFPISRKKTNLRAKYHIKDIYCCKCKKITKHIEIRDSDILKQELLYKDNLNDMEKYVFNLLNMNQEKSYTLALGKKI